MRRRWLALLLCLVVCPLSLVRFVAAGDATLSVNEAATQILFNEQQTKIALALENKTGQTLVARVRLELLDTDNRVRAATTRAELIKAGASRLNVALTPSLLTALSAAERARLLLFRLHYRITQATDADRAPVLTEGYVSLSQLQAPDVFELRVAAPRVARAGQTYRARVHAQRPLSDQPAAGVSVNGELTFDGADGEDVVLKGAGVTDAQGDAALDFKLP